MVRMYFSLERETIARQSESNGRTETFVSIVVVVAIVVDVAIVVVVVDATSIVVTVVAVMRVRTYKTGFWTY